MKSEQEQILEKKTYRQQMGDFRACGKWVCTNSFTFVITHILNNSPQGYVTGIVSGKNIGCCAICGTHIVNHFTVENKEKGEYNVGSECLSKLISEKDADCIKKSVSSIKRQVKEDIIRPLKVAQLNEWLASIWKEANAKRNARIDAELKAYPKKYWSAPYKIPIEWDKKGNKTKERDATDTELSKEAPRLERRDRDFWYYNFENLIRRGWNPNTMKEVYKSELLKENIKMDFKWRELTEEENKKIGELTIKKINEYLAKINRVK
jgi:pimeloyl-CoA synthetase